MAGKKISELTQTSAIANNDLFIVETNEGTRTVPYSMMKPSSNLESVDCAASHNAVFRGKDLTNVYTIDEICERISNGTFEDLYIGDYFDITISTTYTSNESVRCVLAGFDSYMNTGYPRDKAFNQHHAVVITENPLTKDFVVKCTTGKNDGFADTEMWKTIIPIYQTAFNSVLNNHILTHVLSLTKLNDNSARTAGYYDVGLCLLSQIQVFGCSIVSSDYRDIGCETSQLPLFSYNPNMKICEKGYWLRNYSDDFNDFIAVGAIYTNEPIITYSYNSTGLGNSSYPIRPVFCIG